MEHPENPITIKYNHQIYLFQDLKTRGHEKDKNIHMVFILENTRDLKNSELSVILIVHIFVKHFLYCIYPLFR